MNPIMWEAEEGNPIMREAEEGSLSVAAQLASSSPPRDHGSASASASASASSSPSDELSAGGTVCPRPPPSTTTVSGSNTTTSTTGGSAAPNTSIVPIRRDGALNMEIPRQEPRDRNDAEIPREGPRDRNDDDNGPFKLGKIFMILSFSLATALMIVWVQPQQRDSSTNLSSLSSILFNTVRATTIFCFVFTMFGMILKKQHLKVAKICNCIGILLGVLDFFLMISIYTEDSLVWLVRVVAVVVLLASAYFLRGEMGIHSQLSLPCTHG